MVVLLLCVSLVAQASGFYVGPQLVYEPDDWDTGTFGGGIRCVLRGGRYDFELMASYTAGEVTAESGFPNPPITPNRQISTQELAFGLGVPFKVKAHTTVTTTGGLAHRDVELRWNNPTVSRKYVDETFVYVAVSLEVRSGPLLYALRCRRTLELSSDDSGALQNSRLSGTLSTCFRW